MTSPLARRRTPQTPRPRQNGSLKVFWNMYMIMYRTFILDKTIFWEGVAGGRSPFEGRRRCSPAGAALSVRRHGG
jgi:hypothetical protein